MSNASQQIVNKAWNFAHVLRDDGLSHMGYTEQITFLLFLKMADEQTRPPYHRPPIVPPELGWPSLLAKDGDDLEVHYRHILEELGKKPGMLGEIFKKARPDIQNPATLKRLIVDLIDPEQWMSMQADVKGDIYEGLRARLRDPANRHDRKPTWFAKGDPHPGPPPDQGEGIGEEGRWRCFTYDEIAKRDKMNLDIFWLKDKSLEDSENLPEPDVLAQEIADDLQTALEQFSAIASELK